MTHVDPLPDDLVVAYLHRLGLTRDDLGAPGSTSLDALRLLHRAHCARIVYENIDIIRGCPPVIDPVATVQRFVRGRGGYCYLLNGGFSALLASLGYRVTRHVGAVWRPGGLGTGSAREAWGRHLALTVELDGRSWFADVGLGDALYQPAPLPADRSTPVTLHQGPFRYRIEASDEVPGAWRFVHDPVQQSFTAMDFGPEPVAISRFEQRHEFLSTSPDSGFRRVMKLLRRDPDAAHGLTGCVLHQQDGAGRHERVLSTRAEWFDAVADVFGMPLADVDEAGRDALWRWLSVAHEAWLAAVPGI